MSLAIRAENLSKTYTGEGAPVRCLYSPMPMRVSMLTTNRYVGSANSIPDSRTPCRLATVMKAMKSRQISTL